MRRKIDQFEKKNLKLRTIKGLSLNYKRQLKVFSIKNNSVQFKKLGQKLGHFWGQKSIMAAVRDQDLQK